MSATLWLRSNVNKLTAPDPWNQDGPFRLKTRPRSVPAEDGFGGREFLGPVVFSLHPPGDLAAVNGEGGGVRLLLSGGLAKQDILLFG